jgi:hypothetical protein
MRFRPSCGRDGILLASLLAPALALTGATQAQAPATTATSTAIAVEACGQGPALVRPSSMIVTCADHESTAAHLHWTSWTATSATATGQIEIRGCAGDCARARAGDGTIAKFTLTGPLLEDNGKEVLFTKLKVQITGPDPGGFRRSATFGEAPVAAPASSRTGTPATLTPKASVTSRASADLAGRRLSYAAIEGFWIAAGGPSDLASTMAAIAGAESSWQPGIIEPGEPYSTTGWGLWQITPGNSSPSEYGSDYQLLDPWNNAEAAVWGYGEQGLNAWTTYWNGAYESYVEDVTPATGLTDPGEYFQTNSAPPDTPASPQADPGSTYGPAIPGMSTAAQVAFRRGGAR